MIKTGAIEYYNLHHHADYNAQKQHKHYHLCESLLTPRNLTKTVRNIIRKLSGRAAHV